MKLILFILLPIMLSAQNVDSIINTALDKKLIPLDELVTVIDSIVRAVHLEQVTEEPEPPPAVDTKGFLWVDVQGNELGKVGGSITLTSHASIKTFGVSGPVTFRLSGPINIVKDEGSSPYTLFGDIGVRPIVRQFPKGNYQLTASYSGGVLNASFEVK